MHRGCSRSTLLFVVMLAQPDGHDTYDRISWSRLAKPVSVGTAFLMIAVLSMAISGVKENKLTPRVTSETNEVAQAEGHMAHLGAELFSRHLVSVEVAGTLLMVALVGAIAIVIQGKEQVTVGASQGERRHE